MSNLPQIITSLPSAQEFTAMKEIGSMAVKSGFLPTSINSPEKAIIIMLKGREIGIPPMQAFSSIAVINGKPTMSAELMLSMIYKNVPGAIVDFVKTDSSDCIIEAKRPNGKRTKFSFTMEDAKRANLTGKGPWVTYPAAMLRARCISAMARATFPDALHGIVYTPEELGAQIDDDGNILEIPEAQEVAPVVKEEPKQIASPFVKPAEPKAKEHKIAQYVITFGRHKGKTLQSMDQFELSSYLQWVLESAKKNDKPILGGAKEFVEFAEAYLSEKEFKSMDLDEVLA